MSDAGLVASKAIFLGDMLSSNTGTRSATSLCSVRKDCLSSSTRLSNTPCIHTCSACVCVCVVCVCVMCVVCEGVRVVCVCGVCVWYVCVVWCVVCVMCVVCEGVRVGPGGVPLTVNGSMKCKKGACKA